MNIRDVYERVAFRIKNQGLLSLFRVIVRKISEFILPPRSKFYNNIITIITNSKGLEIGGPSTVFSPKGFIPVYNIAKQIDNLNFSSKTIWEGKIERDRFVINGKEIGIQLIREATDLIGMSDCTYDFVLSSEMVQHIANPIKALNEWKRVLRNDGLLVLIVPDKRKTFDHRRPVTQLSHLIEDNIKGISEADLTHLEEALKYHDLKMDRPAGSFEEFKKRSENNFNIRALHHHIFDERLIVELIELLKFQIIGIELYLSTIVILAQKKYNDEIDNSKYIMLNTDI
jgi:SAM-dependent methyltransferase